MQVRTEYIFLGITLRQEKKLELTSLQGIYLTMQKVEWRIKNI